MPNNKTKEKTNKQVDSQKDLPMTVLTFSELWANYPSKTVKHIDPKTKEDVFPDHCAIHLSDALYKSGVRLKSFSQKNKCWNCPTPDDTTKKGIHAIRAQNLADYLRKKPFAGCPEPLVLTGTGYEESVSGKTGIIFFQDYWLRSGESSPTGDHIDLWNKNELASLGTFLTWTRRTFPGFSSDYLDMSDLKNSKQVLFWEIN